MFTKMLLLLLAFCTLSAGFASEKLIIAHRGASGYLPEHTLESYTAAYFMNADYIEQDVVMTRDNQLVLLHDIFLDRVTDAAFKFPNRFRIEADGSKRWRVIDFTLAEIKKLNVTTGFRTTDAPTKQHDRSQTTAIWPERFPIWKSGFRVATLAEAIELIQGLNKATGRNVGIYPEVKNPSQFLIEGKDISLAVLKELKKYGYHKKSDKIFIQCFNPIETRRIAEELLPKLGMELNVIQLIAKTSWNESYSIIDGKLIPYDFGWMLEKGGMKKIAEYADGIGPWKSFLLDTKQSARTGLTLLPMISEAKKLGLKVHPYTFRADEGRILTPAKDFEDMVSMFFYDIGVDAVFTDFPDRAHKVRR
ncbi:glycerophosphodiester phosphodiesterase [Endozoicomonas sp. OPT23]|uniref:glycerophosphodiester phosphodiesterase n=1 Tax=Endozoicomonas sp. OPT23 TaxID=2072845 RepID=UPI00129AC3FB|nr:glycerophosphodiester phosphodiesterase [Endozoicomonas sp. OPT23]MRI35289.1 glycerophosphodiester phosphodiesterase [Endozoicomonas sp. OPT23]